MPFALRAKKTAEQGGLLALCLAGVHPLRDVGGLSGQEVGQKYVVGVENVVRIDVAYLAHGVAHDFLVVEDGLRRDFARDYDAVALYESLAGDAAEFVLLEAGVENAV